ncbi:galactokinase [Engelhardtia mirabilis]|uniref:Galactokinase n=1 Tax=Engelhardtia mirabilis TaxID=2528011 RepID=A0A518BIU7_9BACT|nr:Galactokinase [Planctomycetes bacterium Pla133]QDV01237.1 Galactokinase [Planctomycetes bacterium Pla86]
MTLSFPRPPIDSERSEALRIAFAERFGPGAPRAHFAPGRANLMGAHLDYNGGPVMPMAVDRGTWVAVRRRTDRRVRMASTVEEGEVEWSLDALPDAPSGRWFDYPLGVLRAVLTRPGELPGLDVLFGGDLPIGAGLSSSASICVGTAHALTAAAGGELEPDEGVELALAAERGFVGVQCGIMDPYAVAHSRPGHLLWLDCKDRSVDHVPLDATQVTVAVADSLVRRELAQGAFNERVAQCAEAFELLRLHVPAATCLRDVPLGVVRAHLSELEPAVGRRALHVAGEVARTFEARDALVRGDVAAFGSAMLASHESLREQYEVSTDELDCLVDAAASVDGVLGSRLTGAGFGGCTVVLLRAGAEDDLRAALEQRYAARFGRTPTVAFYRGDPGPRELD